MRYEELTPKERIQMQADGNVSAYRELAPIGSHAANRLPRRRHASRTR